MYIQESQKINANKKKKSNKTLMRLEKPIYQLKKKNQSQTEYTVRKLMNKKVQKPKIQEIQRSPLFSQLEAMMPIFKKANQQLKSKRVEVQQKIDAKLSQVEVSSSSSSDNEDESMTNLKTMLNTHSQMLDESNVGSQGKNSNEIELNILKYELPEQLQPVQIKEEVVQSGDQSKDKQKLIQEL